MHLHPLNESTPRRNFLTNSVRGSLALGLGMSSLASLLQSFTFKEDESGLLVQGAGSITTEAQFRAAVAPLAQMSLMSSQVATTQATNKYAKQFAGFELAEMNGMMSILKDLGTTPPPLDAKAQGMLDQLKAAKGAAFDKAYIAAQIQSHQQLNTLTSGYLASAAPGASNMMEKHGRHIATLASVAIKEHLAITQQISGILGS